MVFADVDSRTDAPIAIKQLRIKDYATARSPEVQNEMSIMQMFSLSVGAKELS